MTTDIKDTANKETSPKRKCKSDKPSTSIAVMAIAYEDDGLTLKQIIKIATKKARELKSVRHVIIAYHDKDTVSPYESRDPSSKHYQKAPGTPKKPHYHIIFIGNYGLHASTVSNWLPLPRNAEAYQHHKLEVNTFYDAALYLLHFDKDDGYSHRYDISDLHVIDPPKDWTFQLSLAIERRVKYHGTLSNREMLYYDIENGMPISEASKKYPRLMLSPQTFDTAVRKRRQYLDYIAQVICPRLNIYIHGGSCFYREVIARMAADLSLISLGLPCDKPVLDITTNTDTIFNQYDGETVIIWNDFDSIALRLAFAKGIDFLNTFSMFPPDTSSLMGNGNTLLKFINQVNIVHGQQTFGDFINDLSGEFGALINDRFAIIIDINDGEESFTVHKVPFMDHPEKWTAKFTLSLGECVNLTQSYAHEKPRRYLPDLKPILDIMDEYFSTLEY